MSIEIETLRYHFRPPIPYNWKLKTKPERPAPPPFRFNPLHDLESVWWVATWFIFCHRVGALSNAELKNAKIQMSHVKQLFPRTLSSHSRWVALTDTFPDWCSCLPTSFQGPALQVDLARLSLLTCYRDAEAGQEIDHTQFTTLHSRFIEFFQEAETQSQGLQLSSLNKLLHDAKTGGGEGGEGSLPPTPTKGPKRLRQ